MSTQIQRTYRIIIDIVTTSYAQPHTTVYDTHATRSHLTIMERLQAHPEVLDPLLRSLVIGRLDEAKKLLDTEYGSRLSEQELLQPIIAELEPEMQAYLTEEFEDGCQIHFFDGFETHVKRYQMMALQEESN